jgi:hypothetical protein
MPQTSTTVANQTNITASGHNALVADIAELYEQIAVRTTGTTYTAADGDIVIVNLSSQAAFTVTAPSSPYTGARFTVKCGAGRSHQFPIAVQPATGTIDGEAAIYIQSPYACVRFVYNGTQWNIVA